MKQTLRRNAIAAMAGMIAASVAPERHIDHVMALRNMQYEIESAIPHWIASPADFGRMYAGSNLKRKNDIRRRHLAKYNK
jgi:alkylation response protein AidB-like acyl-CoA dehydrogenase